MHVQKLALDLCTILARSQDHCVQVRLALHYGVCTSPYFCYLSIARERALTNLQIGPFSRLTELHLKHQAPALHLPTYRYAELTTSVIQHEGSYAEAATLEQITHKLTKLSSALT